MRIGLVSLLAALAAMAHPTPTRAGSADRVKFSVDPMVRIATQRVRDGVTRVRVASNTPFTLRADDVVGRVVVRLSDDMGRNAQAPGPERACTRLQGLADAIYHSRARTAAGPGRLGTQSVTFTVLHDSDAEPDITAVPRAQKPAKRRRCKAPHRPEADG